MLKEEKAKGASSTRRRDLQPLAELCRDKFASAFVPMDPLSLYIYLLLLDALKLFLQ